MKKACLECSSYKIKHKKKIYCYFIVDRKSSTHEFYIYDSCKLVNKDELINVLEKELIADKLMNKSQIITDNI